MKMDVDKTLKKVSTLNEYISVTQEIAETIDSSKLQFNMSTVLTLKKVRSLEIEYFNKCEGKGAALLVFEYIVKLPPSKTWEILGKELVSLLQYWLDAMRKHLIKHNHNWWNFMILLLKFLKLIRHKDQSLPNILMENTAECLFDLATATEPDVLQRLEILYCLNVCCADTSRETRNTMKDKLERYFNKLSDHLKTCYHLPTQFSILETLLRWLLPRHDPAVRHAAAIKWFPEDVFGWKAVQLFLKRPWHYFFQDARDFLNAFNEKKDFVVSVLCRKLLIGTVVVGIEKAEIWLDVNTINNSISILLDFRILDGLGIITESWNTLTITEENILDIQLHRDSSEVTLLLHTSHVPMLLFSGDKVGDGCEIKAVIGTKGIDRLDKILRSKFMSRYKMLLDLDKMSYSMSPVENIEKKTALADDDTRFSHPVEIQKRKRSGYMVRSKNPPWKSPSTASTSSLAYLHEKLALLPRYKFDKEAVHVSALPDLSTVTEVSETGDRQSVNSTSTIKINRPYGVCQKNRNKNSQSDSEVQSKSKLGRYLSPSLYENENSTSCLLVATIGSADESVINDTLERITKCKEYQGDNIVDLLVQEALRNEKLDDSGINTGDNKQTQEPNLINTENTHFVKNNIDTKNNQNCYKTCTVISNTTTDESNDVVYDTPSNFVNVRKRQRYARKEVHEENLKERPVFDVQVVENFFSQHLNENNRGEVVISPTLARKINETSSDSEQFEDCLLNLDDNAKVDPIEIPDTDIIECLKSMVDTICSDIEKCTEIMDKDSNEMISMVNNESFQPKDKMNIEKSLTGNRGKEENKVMKADKGITLKYNLKMNNRPRVNSEIRKAKLDLEVANLSPITETKELKDETITKTVVTPESKRSSTSSTTDSLDVPLTRRKRKLYSPKDENSGTTNLNKTVSCVREDSVFKISKTTNTYAATSYKDIEKDRAKRIRRPLTRRSGAKSERTPSPKTKKNNEIFDNLKEKLESNDSVILADRKHEKDLAVYNITSDSEDEDFKKKKLELRKRISSATVASVDSSKSTRRSRTRINYSENKSSDETKKKKVSKPKINTKRKRQTKIKHKKETVLIDEKMRKQAQEELNTSFVVDKPIQSPQEVPKLILNDRPVLEPINDESNFKINDPSYTDKKTKKPKKTDPLSIKKEKLNKDLEANGNRTESPLPGLVIETMPTNVDDANDSMSVNLMQKLKTMYQDGFENCNTNNDTNTTQNLLSDVDRTNCSNRLNEKSDRIENCDLIIDDVLDNKLNTSVKLSQSKNYSSIIDLEETVMINRRKENKEVDGTKYKVNNKKEIQDIIEISEIRSDKSIATVGKSPITAHGDSNEPPPNPELLTQKLKPRDLEVEYLDKSIKDYYNKLTNEIRDLPSARSSSNSENTSAKFNSPELKSPKVSITKLSIDDISKWFPSRRNSDTYTGSSIQKSITNHRDVTENVFNVFKKSSPRNSRSKQTNFNNTGLETRDNSSVISQKRKSKRLGNQNVKYTDYDSDSDYDNVKPLEITIRENVKELKRGDNAKDSKNYSKRSDDDELYITKLLRTRKCLDTTQGAINKKNVSPVVEKIIKKSNKYDASRTHTYRKSIISPVKMFDEICQNSSKTSSNIKEKKNNINFHTQFKENTQLSSPNSMMSTSTKIIEPKRSKKKFDHPETSAVKKIKLNDTAVTSSESGPSVSSVNDWFKRNAVSRDQSLNTSFSETIQNIMEKLDTTLEEIHQNTTKQFIHMFVGAQKDLALVRQKRRQVYRAVATEVITEVVKIIDLKFADLDQKSQEMDMEFMEQLKVQASGFIREDCKKKQLMINLLKEDVQAVLEHKDKNKTHRL